MTIRDELVELVNQYDYVSAATLRDFLRDHGPALVEALDAKRAIEEQAAVTECVSVPGRDPSEVIRDIVSWHLKFCRRSNEPVFRKHNTARRGGG